MIDDALDELRADVIARLHTLGLPADRDAVGAAVARILIAAGDAVGDGLADEHLIDEGAS